MCVHCVTHPSHPIHRILQVRRRAIVPGFHKAYLNAMIQMFGQCTERTVAKLGDAIDGKQVGGLLGRKVRVAWGLRQCYEKGLERARE